MTHSEVLARIKSLYGLAREGDLDLVRLGYPPEKTLDVLRAISDAFPIGLPDKIAFYARLDISKWKASELIHFYEDLMERLEIIEKAGSMHHLYHLLGGMVDNSYINMLVEQLDTSSTTDDINNVLVVLDVKDPVQVENTLRKIKEKTRLSITVLRQMVKIVQQAGEEVRVQQWDQLLEELLESPFSYLSTGQRLEGYWIRCEDSIDSLYTSRVHYQFMDVVREKLREIDKYGTSSVNEMLQQIAEKKVLTIEGDFAINRDLIHFENGIYVISSGQFIKRNDPGFPVGIDHRRTLAVIPHPYNPDADISDRVYRWETFLDGWEIEEFQESLRIFFGNEKDVIETWWEWMGYCLTKHIFLKKSAMYRGDSNSGKSELSRLQEKILGSKATGASFHSICNEDLGSASALYDVQLCVDDDLGEDLIENYERFKKVTGAATMDFRFMFHDKFTAENTVKFQCCANVLPPVKNIGIPFANRWLVFFFKHVFDEDERDVFWTRRMQNPKVIEYILAKAIFHLDRLMKRGYFVGMDGDTVLHWWQLESNVIYRFIHEICEKVDSIALSDSQPDLYSAFVSFSEAINMRSGWVKSQNVFTKHIVSMGHPVCQGGRRPITDPETGDTKDKTVKVYKGLRFDRKALEKLINPENGPNFEDVTIPRVNDFDLDPIKGWVVDNMPPEDSTGAMSFFRLYCAKNPSIPFPVFANALRELKDEGMIEKDHEKNEIRLK